MNNIQRLRDALETAYLDYVNDYLTVAVFAEHYELSTAEVIHVLEAGERIHDERLRYK